MGRETGLFLDTNVLYGAFECDLFLGIAESGYLPISVHWSDFVLMELRTHLTERLKQLKPGYPQPKRACGPKIVLEP